MTQEKLPHRKEDVYKRQPYIRHIYSATTNVVVIRLRCFVPTYLSQPSLICDFCPSDQRFAYSLSLIHIFCADGLSGIKEAIAAAFPKTEYQRCIVHQVRNTLKYVPDKDRKAFASDLKTIYHASDEEKARLALDRVTEKWTAKYPNSMKRWYDNWDAITPIFKFSSDVRKVIYMINAIESLNSCLLYTSRCV